MMLDFLEFTIDKFTFRIANDRFYTEEGLWVKPDNNQVQVGLSDYLQKRSGDVAFAEVKPAGTELNVGDELAVIETIKVNISLPSPVMGKLVEVNPAMETEPEVINLDPYGTGWLAKLEVSAGDTCLRSLMSAQDYFNKNRQEAEREVNEK